MPQTGLTAPTGHDLFEIGGSSTIYTVLGASLTSTRALVGVSTSAGSKVLKVDWSTM